MRSRCPSPRSRAAKSRQHLKPKRRLPLHDWHEAAGATFVATGLWMRPLVYSRITGWEAVLREARAVRRSVGITDVSTLGKIDVQGPDAAKFLDFIYANTLLDAARSDARATASCCARTAWCSMTAPPRGSEQQHFLVTTTTANAAVVLEHMEFHLQAVCPQFDVLLTDVGDQWAQFAIAGPRSREVLQAVVADLELSNADIPVHGGARSHDRRRRGPGVSHLVFRRAGL